MRRTARILIACAAVTGVALSSTASASAINPKSSCVGTLNNALAQANLTGTIRNALAKSGPRAVGSQLAGLAAACKPPR
jgi:hypothetical protein